MKAEEFPALLQGMEIPGVTVGPVLNDQGEPAKPGSGLAHGFLVTAPSGARIAWQVAVQIDGLMEGDGPAALFPEAVGLGDGQLVCADVEACIGAWIGRSAAAPHVQKIVRYSNGDSHRAIRYGLRLDLYTGGRVFAQALWILDPGEEPNRDNKYRMREAV